jgi:hypothetical protein
VLRFDLPELSHVTAFLMRRVGPVAIADAAAACAPAIVMVRREGRSQSAKPATLR